MESMRRSLVLGAGGFIGSHLVRRLKEEGGWVRGADLRRPEFSPTRADEFLVGDLRDRAFCGAAFAGGFDEVFQLAADMGGAGFVFTGENDADVMHNSALINLHVADACARGAAPMVFYSSSACVYPERNQLDPDNPRCDEASAYPAAPDSEYGWEKLFSERLYLAFARNRGLTVRIARLHNVFGPEGAWNNGREKAPAAICRKVAQAPHGGEIEIWGDGKQTRSFLFIDECLEGILRFARHPSFAGPVNIGSDEMVSINALAAMAMEIAGKQLRIRNVPGPQGVRGRNSDNRLIERALGWRPRRPLREGMEKTYRWVAGQVGRASAARS
jgi:GDP-D-mannose 3',5'-epimerase